MIANAPHTKSKAACTDCQSLHPSDMARAVGIFRPAGPLGYRDSGNPAARIWPTREQAEREACQRVASSN